MLCKGFSQRQLHYMSALYCVLCLLIHTIPFICSMLFGNLYIYFEWNGKTEISGKRRRDCKAAAGYLNMLRLNNVVDISGAF